jgi:hypothetical protein
MLVAQSSPFLCLYLYDPGKLYPIMGLATFHPDIYGGKDQLQWERTDITNLSMGTQCFLKNY